MRWLRPIQTPASTALLLVLAFISLAILPRGADRDRSFVGALTAFGSRRMTGPWIESWHLVRSVDGWNLIASPEDSADALSKAISESPGSVAVLRLLRQNRATGIYDPAVRTFETRVWADFANGQPLTPEELRSAIDVLNQARGDNRVPAESLTYGRGEATRTIYKIRWFAIAHNAAALVVWAALLCSLAWIPRFTRDRREWRRLEAGLCPGCGYDRRATPPTAACPECGRAGAATPPA